MKCKRFAIRALVMLLCVTMLIGMIPVYVSAANSVKIEVGTATIDLDTDVATDGYYTVSVPINITENTGLMWITLDMTYDSKLDLVDWTEGVVFPYKEGDIEEGIVDYEMSQNNVTSRQAADFEKNPFCISYQAPTRKINNVKTGTLINMVFKVPDTIAVGEYPITVSADSILSQEDTDGTDGYDVPVDITSSATTTAGKITVTGTEKAEPLAILDGENIRLIASSNMGGTVGASDPSSAVNVSVYDAETGITTLTISADRTVSDEDKEYFLIKIPTEDKYGNTVYAKNAPYIVVGMSSSTGKSSDTSIQMATGNERLWGKNFKYPTTFSKYVINVSSYTSGQTSQSLAAMSDTETYDTLRFRHGYSKGSTLPAGTNVQVRYVALFDSAEKAAEWMYEPCTVTFKNGDEVFATQTVEAYTALTYPSSNPTADGKIFSGWDIEAGTAVTADITVNAVFTTEELDPYYVFSSSDIGYSSTTAFTPSKVALSENDTSYLHFASKAGSSADNTRIYVSFADELFPAGFTLLDYKYMKIGYRSNIASGTNLDINPYPAGGNGGRAWGKKLGYVRDEAWNGLVVNLSTNFSGGQNIDSTTDYDGDGKITATDIFYNNFDGDMNSMIIKPYYSSTNADKGNEMLDGEYFDIQYIGFFKNEEDANAYVFEQEIVVDALFDGNNITGSVQGGLAYEAVAADTATLTPAHIRYTTTSTAADNAAAGKQDSIRAYVGLNTSNYPESYNFTGAKYMKIGFRSGAAKSGFEINPVFTNGTRLWGGITPAFTDKETWTSVVVDLANAQYNGGEGGNLTGSTAAERWDFVNDYLIKSLLLRPFNTDDFSNTDAYFDVLYVAFFSDEESANAYEYQMPGTGTRTVTFVSNGETFAESKVEYGTALVYPESTPKLAGKVFTGWDVAEGTEITENTTVTAQFRDAADALIVASGRDMKFTFSGDNFPVIFYHIYGAFSMTESFEANGDSYDKKVYDVSPVYDYATGIWKFKEDVHGWYGPKPDNNITVFLNFPVTVNTLAVGISVNNKTPGAFEGDISVVTDAGTVTAPASFKNTESGITNVVVELPELPAGAKNIRYITFNPWMTSGGNITNGSTAYVQYVAGYDSAADAEGYVHSYTAPDTTYTVSVAAAENGTVTVDGADATSGYSAEHYASDLIYLTATANDGYTFVGWYDAQNNKVSNPKAWFTRNSSNGIASVSGDMITVEGALSLTPKFEKNPVVNANVSGTNGTFTVNGGEDVLTTYTGNAKAGTTVTFAATANSGYKVDGWYNITNGQNTLLTKDSTYTLTLNEDIDIEVRFMDETITVATKLAVEAGENGMVSVETGTATDSYLNYANGGSSVSVTAVPNEGYVTAYWTRVTSDGTEVYIGTGDSVSVAPLGAEVAYKPVFVAAGTESIALYLDSQKTIMGVNVQPAVPTRVGYVAGEWGKTGSEGIVDIYTVPYTRDTAKYNLTISYANGKDETLEFKYNQQVKIKATAENPVWKLSVNGGAETVISYATEFVFGASFTTDIVITETEATGDAEAIVTGLETIYDAGAAQIKFIASFELPEGATLVERGVLLTSNSSVADTMEIGTAGVIVGRVNSSPENATKVFIINKSKVAAGSTWYGRPYIIYTQGGVTKTLYADTMSQKAE